MKTEAEKRQRRCCFTGHRPQKLIKPESVVRKNLECEIRRAVAEGFNVFISGMAQGVDIWAAQIVLQLREEGIAVRLICACPFEGFETRWSRSWQKQYQEVLASADLVRFICSGYRKECFQSRNEWMVNHSARVIAVYNGSPSGTKNTIDYARKNGVEVIIIDD